MPLLARTGGADDNVPPLHSRRLVRLVNEHAGATDAAGSVLNEETHPREPPGALRR